jgi:hypothetical protein
MNSRRLLVLVISASMLLIPAVPFPRQNPAQVPHRPGGYPGQLQTGRPAPQGATVDSNGEKLQIATFNLTPREPITENLEQVRAMGASVVEVIKTVLYAQGGEAAANTQGRKLWYDPNTLQLTVTDYPANIRTVSDYIRSLPTMGSKKRSEIIPLKHQTASDMQELVNRVTGAEAGGAQQATGMSVTKTLRVEGELTFRDLRIRVTKINENDVADKNDDSVEFVIRTPTTSEDRTIEEFRSEFIDDYEINVIEVRPSGSPGEGSARFEVRYNPTSQMR